MNRVIECTDVDVSDDSYPCCTVLMSAYNGQSFIREQILSILGQKYVNVTLVIRDDGSTDETEEILKEFQQKFGTSIHIIKGANEGIHRSFAELIESVPESEFIAFADQDDRWDDDKLAVGICALKKFKADFYCCASRLVDQNLGSLGKTTSDAESYKYYMNSNSKIMTPGCQGCTIICSYKFIDYVRGKGYPSYYGHDTWLTIVAYLLFGCIYDPLPHMDYRQHNESWTGNRSKEVSQLVKEFKFYIKGLKRYTGLAKDVLNRFGDELSDTDTAIVQNIAFKDKKIIGRYRALKKLKLGKYGFVQNIGFKLYYIFAH